MNVKDLTEKQLSGFLDRFLEELDLQVIGKEMRLGAFRFDAVAYDQSGVLVVIELKVNATKDTLAQLLLYPYVLCKLLNRSQIYNQKIRAMLITTHIDSNVLELASSLSSTQEITIKICTGIDGALQLVDPVLAVDQVWDQSLVKGICDFVAVGGKLVKR